MGRGVGAGIARATAPRSRGVFRAARAAASVARVTGAATLPPYSDPRSSFTRKTSCGSRAGKKPAKDAVYASVR